MLKHLSPMEEDSDIPPALSDFWMNTLNLKIRIYSRSTNYRGLHGSLCESNWHICFPLSWQQSYQHFGWMPNLTVRNLSDVHHLFRASLWVWEQHIWNCAGLCNTSYAEPDFELNAMRSDPHCKYMATHLERKRHFDWVWCTSTNLSSS